VAREPINPAVEMKPGRTFSRILRYAFGRALAILVSIFVGVFITVVLANRGGQVDLAVRNDIASQLIQKYPGWWYMSLVKPEEIQEEQARMEDAAGLNLPYWPRQMVLTLKALQLNWKGPVTIRGAPGSYYPSMYVNDILLTDLPHTLLLIGTAFFLLFLLGIPLSLFLYRVQGSRIDRFITLLAPISSTPSWVLGVLLILIFAATLHLLPPGAMVDTIPAPTEWQQILVIMKHMLLPVLAILLSLFFQCVYTWRAFFLLYADEDYVELAKAKGLSNKVMGNKYILRPTLVNILTSFALMLTGFWQMTIALEKVFNWPGIGRLYILSLPNFLGEAFFPGVMPMTLAIVVLFAYLMGVTVFLLDISYALVDPRVRIGTEKQTLKVAARKARRRGRLSPRPERLLSAERTDLVNARGGPAAAPAIPRITFQERIQGFRKSLEGIRSVFREIVRFPSAVFGMIVILLFVIGSIYAVTVFPYEQLGKIWYTGKVTGGIDTPRSAEPSWVNWFRSRKFPQTIVMDSRDGTGDKMVVPSDPANLAGGNNITFTFTFDYPYEEFPQDLVVYLDSTFEVKRPFVGVTWITPDGREYNLGSIKTDAVKYYLFSKDVPFRPILSKNEYWQKWFVPDGIYPTPAFYLLFADPQAEVPTALPGKYTLRLDGFTFEENSNLEAKFVLLGRVFGVAGTDYMRRDLLVPLLWGMPFALVFGLLGSCVTISLSVLIAATGAWFGGWVDRFVQWLVEMNMVLPVIAISVLIYSYFDVGIWTLLGIIVILNVFGSPTKSLRAAILQVKESPYVEAARSYGASNGRIIFQYLIPRIAPILIPQLVIMIPSYVFLEATLGIFNVNSPYPTWGRVIYEGLRYGANWGSPFWVLEPISLLILTGLAFTMLGFALERVLNPRLQLK
jgi:peptide/nickel transport system permease protein